MGSSSRVRDGEVESRQESKYRYFGHLRAARLLVIVVRVRLAAINGDPES